METERIKTENRLTIMEQKIDNLTDKVQDIACDIKKLDDKYSGKWVEKALLVLIGIVATGLIGAILKIILK